MKVQLYVVDTHGIMLQTKLKYKDHEREFVFGKNDFENALLLLDTFFIEAYFCIIYSTGYNTT